VNQTRLGSLIETLVSLCLGFLINWTANMWILPLYGFHITGSQAFTMGLIFTVISVIRQYAVRRWFNHRLHKVSQQLAGRFA
jgi:hypothetical protein